MTNTDFNTIPSCLAPQEVELKLYVSPSAIELLRVHPELVGRAITATRVARIDNRYFDTPDGLLMTRRMALRLRRIGSRWLQTLKVAPQVSGAMSSRHEWEMQVAGPRLELDRLADTPLMDIASPDVLMQKLAQVFTTNFRRELCMLAFKDGTTAEWAIDTGTIATGRGKTRRMLPISELEIEIKSGDAATLLRFAARLALDLPLIPLAASKSARGYALAMDRKTRPEKVKLPPPQADTPTKPYLVAVVAACLQALLANVHALIAAGQATDIDGNVGLPDSEFVHQARVAVRRLRSALRTLRAQVGRRRFIALNNGLREAGQAFGAARDRDVFVEETLKRIEAVVGIDGAGKQAMAQVGVAARQARLEANAALQAYLHSPALARTALMLERFVLAPSQQMETAPGQRLAPSLGQIAPRLLERQQRRIVERSRRIAELDAEQRHDLRIEVKRLRYAIDLFAGLYEVNTAEAYLEALAALQQELGLLNDASVALNLLQTLPSIPQSSEPQELAGQRYQSWLTSRIRKRLPKIAALAVAFELTPRPWTAEP